MIMFGEITRELAVSKGKIIKTEEKIDGDSATVNVKYENGEDEEYGLAKIDGKWKIVE